MVHPSNSGERVPRHLIIVDDDFVLPEQPTDAEEEHPPLVSLSVAAEPGESAVVPSVQGIHQVRYKDGRYHYWEVDSSGKKEIGDMGVLAAYEHELVLQGKRPKGALPSNTVSKFGLWEIVRVDKAAAATSPAATVEPRKAAVPSVRPVIPVEISPPSSGPKHRAEGVSVRKRYFAGLGSIAIGQHAAEGTLTAASRDEKRRRTLWGAGILLAAGALTAVVYGVQHNGGGSGGDQNLGPTPVSPTASGPTTPANTASYNVKAGVVLIPKSNVVRGHQLEHRAVTVVQLRPGDTIWGLEEDRHPRLDDTQIYERVDRDLRANHISWAAAHYLQIGQDVKLINGK